MLISIYVCPLINNDNKNFIKTIRMTNDQLPLNQVAVPNNGNNVYHILFTLFLMSQLNYFTDSVKLSAICESDVMRIMIIVSSEK